MTIGEEVSRLYRRAFGWQSPMCVWRKTFTHWDDFSELHRQIERDFELFKGDKWPIGCMMNIRRPARFIVNRIGG